MSQRGQKRPAESLGDLSLELTGQLPPQEVEAVRAALERWGHLRRRAEALRPCLQREDELMQEILDRGLRSEDRKVLRKLASGGSGPNADDEVIKKLTATIGKEQERLQQTLMQNHSQLLQLSATAEPDYKRELLLEMDSVRGDLQKVQDAVHSDLLVAKERADMDAVRSSGRSLNDLKALLRKLEAERRGITRNSVLATLLVTVCRRVLPVRQIDPAELRDIVPSKEGYMRIMDFYLFSDASLYCFGEHYCGPNWFTRLKRNVAILSVQDDAQRSVYNTFAVSGEHKTPGAPPALESGPLQSIEAEDEHGRVFDRRHDAEFKLLTGFCLRLGGMIEETRAAWTGSGVLWSKKPLCRSCIGAVRQLEAQLPGLKLQVVVGLDDDSACQTKAASVSSGHTACSATCEPAIDQTMLGSRNHLECSALVVGQSDARDAGEDGVACQSSRQPVGCSVSPATTESGVALEEA